MWNLFYDMVPNHSFEASLFTTNICITVCEKIEQDCRHNFFSCKMKSLKSILENVICSLQVYQILSSRMQNNLGHIQFWMDTYVQVVCFISIAKKHRICLLFSYPDLSNFDLLNDVCRDLYANYIVESLRRQEVGGRRQEGNRGMMHLDDFTVSFTQ